MPEFEFKPLGGEPIDKEYVRFRDGWSTWIIGKKQPPGLRWSPYEGEGDWRTYSLDKFDYIDFGVVGPRSPLAYRWQFGERPGYIWEWDGFFMPQGKLPDLWREVGEAYARIKGRRPASVWNPYDGSWREMRRQSSPQPEPGEPPNDRPNAELERRLDELISLYRDGKITDEILKQRTLELTREYG